MTEPTVYALPTEPPVGTVVEITSGRDAGLNLVRRNREGSAAEYHWGVIGRGTYWRWDEVLRYGARVVDAQPGDPQ